MTLSMVGETIAYGDLGVAVAFDQTWKIMTMLSHLTTEEQRQRWLPIVMDDDECLLAAAATEPMSGSDTILPYNGADGGIQMTAEKRGDHWVLNGTKRYISNGGLAKVIYVMARTDPSKPPMESIVDFILKSDTPGYSCTEVWDKLGQRNVQNGTLEFNNVEIPDEDVIGEPGNALAEVGALLTRFGSNIQAGATVQAAGAGRHGDFRPSDSTKASGADADVAGVSALLPVVFRLDGDRGQYRCPRRLAVQGFRF
jgi:alkylation response protein AidB-like acyl-CoA dehydrogenase